MTPGEANFIAGDCLKNYVLPGDMKVTLLNSQLLARDARCPERLLPGRKARQKKKDPNGVETHPSRQENAKRKDF